MASSKLPKPKFGLKRPASALDLPVPSNSKKNDLYETNMKPKLRRELTSINAAKAIPQRKNILRRSKSFDSVRAPLKQNVQNRRPDILAVKTFTALSTAKESTSTKQPKAKIPPYDYKARYNDLLSKHNIIKSNFAESENKLQQLQKSHLDSVDEISTVKLELSNIKHENLSLQRDLNNLKIKFSTIDKEYRDLKISHTALQEQYDDIVEKLLTSNAEIIEYSKKNIELSNKNQFLTALVNSQSIEISDLKKSNQFLQESLQRYQLENKNLNNTVLDLKGNIRVFCRIRPTLSVERGQKKCVWNFPSDNSLDLLKADISNSSNSKLSKQEFFFDRVFPPSTTQEDIFEEVKLLLQSAIDGYNVCIFAYGQTGSGKTYTMEGSNENSGIIPRTIEYIFDKISEYESLGWSFKISASFLEVYNEQLRDLINTSREDLEIRLLNGKEKKIFVTNLEEMVVSSRIELKELFDHASYNRATAQTDGNARSSRSHLVSKIVISSTNTVTGNSFMGVLNLVDLAGSESAKNSMRMLETKNINKSLAQLGKVILSLQHKDDNIPYRDSKLTYLLMPSLGGSSKTLMIVNINPLQANYSESMNSLRFAAQVNRVKTLKASKNRSAV